MKAIGCLVPEFRSEKCRRRGTQLFEKTQCFLRCYVSPYTIVLRKIDKCSCKRQLESRQRHLEKAAVLKAGAYVVSIGRKTTVYRLEAGEIAFFGNTYRDVHSNSTFAGSARFSFSGSQLLIYGLKSVAAKAAMTAMVPTPLTSC